MHTPWNTCLACFFLHSFSVFSLIMLCELNHLHYTLPYIVWESCQMSSCVLTVLCENQAENHGTHLQHLKGTWFSSMWKSHFSKIWKRHTLLQVIERWDFGSAGCWIQQGYSFGNTIKTELLLCVSYISCEKHRCSRDPISVSAVAVLYCMWFQ